MAALQTAGLIAQGVGGLAQVGLKIGEGVRANRRYKDFDVGERADELTNTAISKAKRSQEQLAYGRDPSTAYAEQGIEEDLTAGLNTVERGATSGSQMLAGSLATVQGASKSREDLAAREAQRRQRQIQRANRLGIRAQADRIAAIEQASAEKEAIRRSSIENFMGVGSTLSEVGGQMTSLGMGGSDDSDSTNSGSNSVNIRDQVDNTGYTPSQGSQMGVA